MRENIDYARYNPKVDTGIDFIVAGKAMKASEEYDEILEITKKLFKITNGFYIPTEIWYGLYVYSKDYPINDLLELDQNFKQKIRPLEDYGRKIQLDNEISYEDLIKDIRSIDIKGDVKTISSISCTNGKTKLVLNRRDEFIDKTSNNLYMLQQMDGRLVYPSWDPINLRIAQSFYKDETKHVESDDSAYYKIAFDTFTDIWFANNEFGSANQDRFKRVLKDVYDSFTVTSVVYTSDLYSEDWLRDTIHNLST